MSENFDAEFLEEITAEMLGQIRSQEEKEKAIRRRRIKVFF